MPSTSIISFSALASVPPSFTDDPIPHFDSGVPSGFLHQYVEMLFRIYDLRDFHMARFPKPERHDLWAHYKRALIEAESRQLALDHNMISAAEMNVSCNAFHTVVRGGIIVLTQSFVDERGYLPRDAEFRKTLTRTSQYNLFPKLVESPDPAAHIYAILTHGQSADDQTEPGFADVLFPAIVKQDNTVVIAKSIRLFEDRFPELVARLRSARMPTTHEQENIPDQAEPRLRDSEGLEG